MTSVVNRVVDAATSAFRSPGSPEYEPLAPGNGESTIDEEEQRSSVDNAKEHRKRLRRRLSVLGIVFLGLLLFLYWAIVGFGGPKRERRPCGDRVGSGYQCQPEISHFWGQYSPYFSVPSEISAEVPSQCQITFAQILSRHGARDPTASKSLGYNATVQRIHANTQSYSKQYAFVKDYKYKLGADQLNAFGEQQLANSGIKYYDRYKKLAKSTFPFIRTSGQERVIQSARYWSQGFHDARKADDYEDGDYPYNIVIISEDEGSNNTLDHGLCDEFESGRYSTIADNAQATWLAVVAPPIAARLNKNLRGANLTNEDALHVMDLCPFETVASLIGTVSQFCSLFTPEEWRSYGYYQSLGKFYGYGWGNPLGPTQGVGFSNELIARLTHSPVKDHTSTNSTLDGSQKTFPLGPETKLYADFSHDNDLTAIFSALGFFNETRPLLNTTYQSEVETKGYSASWSVPFAARAYFEKLNCAGAEEEFVRVIMNDRVLPLKTCGGDELGRCTLSNFIQSLSFVRSGGQWDKCFV